MPHDLRAEIRRQLVRVPRWTHHAHRFEQQHVVKTRHEQKPRKSNRERAIDVRSHPSGQQEVYPETCSRRQPLIDQRQHRKPSPRLQPFTRQPQWFSARLSRRGLNHSYRGQFGRPPVDALFRPHLFSPIFLDSNYIFVLILLVVSRNSRLRLAFPKQSPAARLPLAFSVSATPLESTLANQLRVLPCFGRNCPSASTLESTLTSTTSPNFPGINTYTKEGGHFPVNSPLPSTPPESYSTKSANPGLNSSSRYIRGPASCFSQTTGLAALSLATTPSVPASHPAAADVQTCIARSRPPGAAVAPPNSCRRAVRSTIAAIRPGCISVASTHTA